MPLASKRGESLLKETHCLPNASVFETMLAMAFQALFVWPHDLNRSHDLPQSVQVPMFKDSGPKNHTLNGFWDQSA